MNETKKPNIARYAPGSSAKKSAHFGVRWFCERYFKSTPYPEESAAALRQAHQEGIVAYVHRSENSLLHLALTTAVETHDLPPIEQTAFHSRPLMAFSRAIQSGKTAIELFLKAKPPRFWQARRARPDYIRALVSFQRRSAKPIFIAGQVLIQGIRPSHLQVSTTDRLFGSREEPGVLRLLLRTLLSHRWARWQALELLNLQTFMAEHAEKSDETIARRVRWHLIKEFNRIERTFYGPRTKSYLRLKSHTLRDKDLQIYTNQIVAQTGVPKQKMRKKAEQYYEEIAARFDIDVIRIFDKVLGLIWNRIYDGLKWDKKDTDKLREASKKAPLVIIPSHKSHMDYLVMSQVLYWEGLMLPHIAAGANLSFFPLGAIFRRGGAFFIRRSFKGDPLYPQVVRSYVRRLFRDGYTQEFFIEGGRSRSGKTLPPKLGLLAIMVECLTRGKLTDAVFMPASISYEKLVEAGAYRRELEGGEKVEENTTNLLGSAHLLRKRYGQVYVKFDEPIYFAEFLKERGLTHDNLDETKKRELTKALAHRIAFGMNRCSVITPTALIAASLLGAHRRTLSATLLSWHIKKLMGYIRQSPIFADASGKVHLSALKKSELTRALDLLVNDGVVTKELAGETTYYRVPKKSALSLDYYKNNLIHYLASDAIIATALLALTGKSRNKRVRRSALHLYTRHLSRIFKYEFVYPVGESFDSIFGRALERAAKSGLIVISDDYLSLNSNDRAQNEFNFATRTLANFVDAYWVCATKLKSSLHHTTNLKALTLKLLDALREAQVSGATDCPEAVNKSLVENALSLFVEDGILDTQKGAPQLGAPEDLAKLDLAVKILEKAHYNR